MIQDYYQTLERYSKVDYTDDYGNQSTTDNYTLAGTFQGLVQARGGDYIQQNNEEFISKASILYTDISQSFEVDQVVKQSGIYYRIMFEQDTDGISSVGDHQEIAVIKRKEPTIV